MSVVTRVRAWPRNAATGALVAVYLAGGNDGRPHHDGANHYMAGVANEPRFEQSISFTDEGWGARAVPAVGGISWKPADPSRLDALAALYWRDAAIEVDRIKDRVVTRRLTGTVAEAAFQDGGLLITCADLTNRLDQAITGATFAGTGGIEGDDVVAGRTKRRSFGRVWNVEGRLLLKAYNIFEFGDPARPLQACVALRDKGRAGPLGIVAWQGSIAATLDALKASQPQQGGGVFAPSIACAKWWTTPSGPLTADLRGEALGYSENVVGIAGQLLAAVNGPMILDANLAAALRPGVAGLHIRDNNETCPSALNRLLQPVTLIWMLNGAGQVEIREWTFDDPLETLNATFIGRASTLQPVWKRTLGYQRNERVQSDGEISAAVAANDVVYDDGTTAQDLKPAEAGATNGMNEDERADFAAVKDDLNILTPSVFDLGALLETYNAIMQARTTLGGQAIGTVVTDVRTITESAVNDLSLLGAKNAEGTAWNLSLATVQVGGGKTLAQRFNEVEANAANGLDAAVTDLSQAIIDGDQASALRLNAVEATLNGAEGEPGLAASVAQLMEATVDEDGNVLAKYVMALKANGRIGGVVGTNDGQFLRLAFDFDDVRFYTTSGDLLFRVGNADAGEDPLEVYAPRMRVGKLIYDSLVPHIGGSNVQLTTDGGFQKLPGGMIFQWGRIRQVINDEVAFSVVFPIQFPTGVMAVNATPYINTGTNLHLRDLWVQNLGTPSVNGASFFTQAGTGNDQKLDGIDWMAFGY